jgi:hypothetical protein
VYGTSPRNQKLYTVHPAHKIMYRYGATHLCSYGQTDIRCDIANSSHLSIIEVRFTGVILGVGDHEQV